MTSKRRLQQKRERLARKQLQRRRRTQLQQHVAAYVRTARRMEAAVRAHVEQSQRVIFRGTGRLDGLGSLSTAERMLRDWKQQFPAMVDWLKEPKKAVSPVLAKVDYTALEQRVLAYAERDAKITEALYSKFYATQEEASGHPQEARRQAKQTAMAWPYGIMAGASL